MLLLKPLQKASGLLPQIWLVLNCVSYEFFGLLVLLNQSLDILLDLCLEELPALDLVLKELDLSDCLVTLRAMGQGC